MIEKFAAAWPALRKVIYILLAAGLAVAFTYGKVTAEQQASILESGTQLLGFVGFVIAILYTPKGGRTIGDGTNTPVEYHVNNTMAPPVLDERWQSTTPSATIPLPSVEQVTAAVGPTIAELRAGVERSLSRLNSGG